MKITSRRTLAGILLVAVALCAIVLAGGAAAKQHSSNAATVRMTLKHGKLGFTGPATVRSGERLRVRNLTNSGRVGPHTFTLIRGNLLPRGQKEKQKCFTGHHVCNRVLKAHQVDFSTNPPTVGKPNVDDGTRGWDKQFGHHGIRGDSWFAPRKNDVTSRPVTAKPGTVLHFFCVVHPGMRGKIRVTR